ncbi:hypothetical protein HAX54_027255 [Datura stramonium]|uniref:Uncharacterized protein n=1 Tax=Datura stramonium TaxID=4076 RepID=A0ABS8V489_DATST|nr:hypothetical protein [Datura stramonium]
MASNNSKKDIDRVKDPWSPEEDELLKNNLFRNMALEIGLLLVPGDLANLAGYGDATSYLLSLRYRSLQLLSRPNIVQLLDEPHSPPWGYFDSAERSFDKG